MAKMSREKRRYLIALIEDRICPKCKRPMFRLPHLNKPKQCWRCLTRERGF